MRHASDSKKERQQKSGFVRAAVLAASLMLPSCHTEQPPNHQPSQASVSSSTAPALIPAQAEEPCMDRTGFRVGDDVQYGPFVLRVSAIDEAGVSFIWSGPEPQATELVRLNYGQDQRMGEFVLHYTLRAERGSEAGTARILTCVRSVAQASE